MEKYAYIRVSTKDQNIDRQVEIMKNIGIEKNKMFIDKQSGKDFERKNYKKMINKLCPGDEIYIKSIDRLGRDYEEIIEQKGVKFGRPRKEIPENFESIYKLWKKNLISQREAGRMLKISHTTFQRLTKRYTKL